jgi:hypothetical protein
MSALALALLLAAAPAEPPASPEVDRLVDQMLAACGGLAALKAAPARVDEGTTTSLLHPGQTARIRRLLGPGGFLRVAVLFRGTEEEVRVLRDGRATRNGEDVSGSPSHAAMVLQAARLQLPLLLHQARRFLVDRGLQEVGGKKVRVLELSVTGGLLLQAAIDPATGRILHSSGASEGGLRFATAYADFRKVKGVVVPFHEENFAQGRRTGETVLEKVELTAELPPGAADEGRRL